MMLEKAKFNFRMTASRRQRIVITLRDEDIKDNKNKYLLHQLPSLLERGWG